MRKADPQRSINNHRLEVLQQEFEMLSDTLEETHRTKADFSKR